MDKLECPSKSMGGCIDVSRHKTAEHPHGHCLNTNAKEHLYIADSPPINITFINVCGLLKKLTYPEFVDYVKKI